MKPAALKQRDHFECSNTIAARVILTDPDKFGGDEALAVRWARAFTARMEAEQTQKELRKAA